LPNQSELHNQDRLVRVPAVELFTVRARAADPVFRLDVAAAPKVAELCRRLDGLPLAIELAAARSRGLTPVLMLERIDRRLDLLHGLRDRPAHPQALPISAARGFAARQRGTHPASDRPRAVAR